jgi:hypothetical protein
MKNKFTLLSLFFVVFLLNACSKEEVDDVNFNVTAEKNNYSLSDSVLFKIDGNPDVITFYSGEPGRNFDYKDRTIRTDGVFKFGFQIRCDDPNGFIAIANKNFKVLVSNNYLSSYSTSSDVNIAASQDSAMINKATWVDITSRFALPSSGTINTFYTVLADLSDIAKTSVNPLYFAFKCDGNSFGALGANGITIGSLSLSSSYSDGTVANYNLVPGGTISTTWKILKLANASNSWATSSTQLKFTSTATTAYSEDWAISNGFAPSLAVPDVAVPIKNITNKPLTSYKYKFPKVGDYKVVFMASNNRPNSIKPKIKEIYLTINP